MAARKSKYVSKKQNKKQRRSPISASRPQCGLCGKTGKLTKTECCDQWICDDEDEYVLFSFARNSCSRNHNRFTLCGYHYQEEHEGHWKDCPQCREDFEHELETYVYYGTNEYNFEKLETPPEYEPTHCAKCGRVIVLSEGGYSIKGGEYTCDNCSDIQLPDFTGLQNLEDVQDPEALVDMLFEEGDRLSGELRDKILSVGAACIQPLLGLLDNEGLQMEDAPGEGWVPIYAARLLGEMGAPEAIPSMVKWLRETDYDIILHGELMGALEKIGAPVVEPLLVAYRQTKDSDFQTSICGVLNRTGVHHEEIYNALIKQFEEDPELGAGFLAEYGDPRALPELQRVLDAYEITDELPDLFAHQPVIELQDAIETLGGQLTPAQQEKFERVIALREAARAGLQQRTVRQERKIGRNEPCWCGSGKKYKRCHWEQDRTRLN